MRLTQARGSSSTARVASTRVASGRFWSNLITAASPARSSAATPRIHCCCHQRPDRHAVHWQWISCLGHRHSHQAQMPEFGHQTSGTPSWDRVFCLKQAGWGLAQRGGAAIAPGLVHTKCGRVPVRFVHTERSEEWASLSGRGRSQRQARADLPSDWQGAERSASGANSGFAAERAPAAAASDALYYI